jgi:putative transposase
METDDEAIKVHAGADHRGAEGAPGGGAAPDLCRKHGISEATFYAWRSKYGGMEVSDARKLKSLEEENARLKKLLAESMLDVSTLREMLAKNF